MRCAAHAYVSGLVQGVGFRFHVSAAAREHDVAGWVRNLADGRVEVWMEGTRADVDALVAWLRTGPPLARVTDVQIDAVDPRAYAQFEVRRA